MKPKIEQIEQLKTEIEDLKQYIFKMKSDAETMSWENAYKDRVFINEIEKHLVNGNYGMVAGMLNDWVKELTEIINKK